MTPQEQLDRLTGIVESLASSVVAHDNQIEALISISEQHQKETWRLDSAIRTHAESVANTERQWQAYLRTLSKQ